MANIPQWFAKGDWFDVCSCDIPCPCEFAQAPTNDRCFGVLAYHVRTGRYGEVALDNLNLILLASFSGNLWTGQARDLKMGLFMDSRADDKQREAMGMIFGGNAGGFPAWLSGVTGHGEMVGMEVAQIDFEVADGLAQWHADIAGKVGAAAAALNGPTTPAGKRVQTLNPPGSETGGTVATWGKTLRNRVNAMGMKWDVEGKSSKHIPFDWSGPGKD
ncbi:MAG: DUF1326 domain-containing protein [Candidatus Binataceae bacterium]|nr:DUF1326 domain-containing protein [Candidatus Binataceae bacterium]